MEPIQVQLSNYDRYYAHYTWPESLLMTMITAVSNLISLPLVYRCFKLKQPFVALMCLSSILSSFLYHFGEIYNCVIFLDFSAWHRLDNIFAITCMSIYLLYLTGNIFNPALIYSTVLIAILVQEKDPWNINYTVGPIIMYLFIGVGANIYYKIGFPEFRYDQLVKGTVLLLIGMYFFAKGLDQHTDYLRLNHGIWHVFLGLSSWFNMDCIKNEKAYMAYMASMTQHSYQSLE